MIKNSIEVFNFTLKDIPRAAYTLFRAFEHDPLMMWIFGSKQAYENKGLELFKTWVKYCVLYGTVIRTNNFESVAIRRKPGDTKLRLWRILRSGMYKNPVRPGPSPCVFLVFLMIASPI